MVMDRIEVGAAAKTTLLVHLCSQGRLPASLPGDSVKSGPPQHRTLVGAHGCLWNVDFRGGRTAHRHFDPRKELESRPSFPKLTILPTLMSIPSRCGGKLPARVGIGDSIWIQRDVELNLDSERCGVKSWLCTLLGVHLLTGHCISLGLRFLFHKIQSLPCKRVISIK